jgi:hypothetical protein
MLHPLIGKIKDFYEKGHEKLFLALFAVHTGKKKYFVKKCEFTQKSVKFREFTRIRVKKCEFGSTVVQSKWDFLLIFLFVFYCPDSCSER